MFVKTQKSFRIHLILFQGKLDRGREGGQEAEERLEGRNRGWRDPRGDPGPAEEQAQPPPLRQVPGQVPQGGRRTLRQDEEALQHHRRQEVRTIQCR